MVRIKFIFWFSLGLLSALWLSADTWRPQPFTYFSFRAVFMQYSGVIATGVMSMAIVLASRARWLEPRLDGLDKMYRLHKWLGITALIASLLHWWWGKGTKWMVGWGWLSRPSRRPPSSTVSDLGLIEGWLRAQRGLAESAGEWAFYAVLVLLVLALVKRFPYHLFTKTHKWLSIAYLVLIYHSVVLLKAAYWARPIGWVMAVLMVAGTTGALWALLGRIGATRKVQGAIESLHYYPELRVLESGIVMAPGWPGHRAGQFAFVTSSKREGAHPYTIASAWRAEDHRIVFITKALGDHTRRLPERLKVGMPVTVEGPYGCFDFQDERPRQIWIGAGIGITPFVARMKQMAGQPDAKPIDLFHPTSVYEQAAIDKLTADAAAAGIHLHLLVADQDGRLDGARIRAEVPDWAMASIWFCGPPMFGKSLRDDFIAHGMSAKHFHQELFQMR